jgi:hypothetical protein
MTGACHGRASPTLAELRATAQKQQHREIGNWLARWVGRPTALYGTWLAVRLGLSAHTVTLMALAASVAAALAFMTGTRTGFIAGVLLGHLAFWLDHVDGQVARWRRTATLDGVYADYMMHHAVSLCLGFSLGYGLAARSGDLRWTMAGLAIALGWTMLGLHNDCRYKAFFQRLKRETGTFRVEGGRGSRPAPPAPWPRRGLGALTWPAYKACEPHVVLVALTALALVALVHAPLWLTLWRGSVRVMALLAPTLAFARAVRTVTRQSVTREFDGWFEPCVRDERLPEDPFTTPWTRPREPVR